LKAKIRHLTGTEGLPVKETARIILPSQKGKCKFCKKNGAIRYFVACPLDEVSVLCDDHYSELRDLLKQALAKIIDSVKEGIDIKLFLRRY